MYDFLKQFPLPHPQPAGAGTARRVFLIQQHLLVWICDPAGSDPRT